MADPLLTQPDNYLLTTKELDKLSLCERGGQLSCHDSWQTVAVFGQRLELPLMGLRFEEAVGHEHLKHLKQ